MAVEHVRSVKPCGNRDFCLWRTVFFLYSSFWCETFTVTLAGDHFASGTRAVDEAPQQHTTVSLCVFYLLARFARSDCTLTLDGFECSALAPTIAS